MGITASTFDPNNKGASVTLSGGNLTATVSSGTGSVMGTNRISGPTYFEMVIGGTLTGSARIGLANPAFTLTGLLGVDNNGIGYDSGGTVKINNATVATIATYTTSSVVCVAVDPVNKLIWFRSGIAGNWNNDVLANQNPVGSVGGISYATVNLPSNPAWGGSATSSVTARFASGSWTGTAPTGYAQVDTLGSSTVNGDVASRSASFTQYGRANGPGSSVAASDVSAFPARRDVTVSGAWFGGTREWSPAATMTKISGQVQQLGSPVSGKLVFLHDSANGLLLGSAISDGSGNFSIPALGRTNVYAVCLDPAYQAIVYDQLTPV